MKAQKQHHINVNTSPKLAKLVQSCAAWLALLLVMFCGTLHAAPKSELWPMWNVSIESDTRTISHQDWQLILDRYLHASGTPEVTRFNYGAVSVADKSLLQRYINALANTPILTFNRAQQKAFWINLYNAVTVRLILDHYPVDSIRQIKFGFFSFGPWNEKLVTVNGQPLSLNDIEHRILRPIWQDNRIHYAVNCASVGCPNLARFAYDANNTNALLAQGARDYINHPRAVDLRRGVLHLSSIYEWYSVDFGGSEASVISHLQRYANPQLKARLASHAGGVEYDYDWNLNRP